MAASAAARAKERVLPSLDERAVGLALTFRMPHFTRREEGARIEGIDDEAQDAFKVSKEILKAPEYTRIYNYDNVTYWKIRAMALPHWFRRGEYLLAVSMIDRAESYLQSRLAGRLQLVREFLDAYPRRRAEAKERLGDLYDASEYPTVEALEARFSMEWDYPAFGVARALEYVKQSVWKREQAKLAEKGEKAIDAITMGLRLQVKKVVDHWVGVLGGEGDGKPKVFKEKSLDTLRAFLTDVRLKNITDDTALDNEVEKVLATLGAADAKELRKDAAYREVVLRGFETVKAAVDKLAEEKPVRKIRF